MVKSAVSSLQRAKGGRGCWNTDWEWEWHVQSVTLCLSHTHDCILIFALWQKYLPGSSISHRHILQTSTHTQNRIHIKDLTLTKPGCRFLSLPSCVLSSFHLPLPLYWLSRKSWGQNTDLTHYKSATSAVKCGHWKAFCTDSRKVMGLDQQRIISKRCWDSL